MKHDDIPVKTSEGIAEIKTRAQRLAPRMRTALLLVDGVKPVSELTRMMAGAGVQSDALEILLEKGLISLPVAPTASVEAPAPAPEEVESSSQPDTTPPVETALEPEVSVPREVPAPKATVPVMESIEVKASARAPAAAPEIKPAPPAKLVRDVPQEPRETPKRSASPIPKAAAATEGVATRQPVSSTPDADEPSPRSRSSTPKASPGQTAERKKPASGPDAELRLMRARAHLASVLDEHVGIQTYVLQQCLIDCTSVEELESYFDQVEKSLSTVLKAPKAADLVAVARTVLQE